MRPPRGLLMAAALTTVLIAARAVAPGAVGLPAAVAVPLRDPGIHARPVPGEVVHPFQAPATTFASGHRGVDLAAAPGDPVGASAAGTVRFAGTVADQVWVTVDHGQGIRTTYGPLGDVEVAPGQAVTRGAILGSVAGPPHDDDRVALHWGARRGDTYIDPMGLLVPLRASLVGPGSWHVGDLPDVPSYRPWDGRHHWGLVPRSRGATGPGWVLPPNPNRVIGIAGLGSRTGEPPFDLTHLGYEEGDVAYLSYAPDGGPYGPEHTWQGVDAAARRLEEDLREAWAADPGRAVDLVGHSMGGVVALHYLLHHHDPTDPGLPPIGNVVTVASPLEGADLAQALAEGDDHPLGWFLLEAAGRLVPGHDPTSQAIEDLAVDGELIAGLTGAWAEASRAPYSGPLATGTRVLTLGGDLDLVVPEHRSDLNGAAHVVLPGTHDGVRRTEAVRIVAHEFLAGRPVPGEPGGIGHWLSRPVGWFERTLVDGLLPG